MCMSSYGCSEQYWTIGLEFQYKYHVMPLLGHKHPCASYPQLQVLLEETEATIEFPGAHLVNLGFCFVWLDRFCKNSMVAGGVCTRMRNPQVSSWLIPHENLQVRRSGVMNSVKRRRITRGMMHMDGQQGAFSP